MGKTVPDKLYFKISEVSKIAGLQPYVLRFWESEFSFIRPLRTKSNQRLYRKRDLEMILKIKRLLYEENYTIAGAKKRLRELNLFKGKQLELQFSEKKYERILKRVIKELKALRKLVD